MTRKASKMLHRLVLKSLERNPGAEMIDLAVGNVWGMLFAAQCAAKKEGATVADIVAALAARYEHAKKDLRAWGKSMFKIDGETRGEAIERLMNDPEALAQYEKMCADIWAQEDAELAALGLGSDPALNAASNVPEAGAER
jgi:hypothetical protein